jgi:predicted PurR-regulated permease PerM
MGPVPPAVAYDIFASSARFFRGYLYGSTLVGLFNGAVMGVGALIIGVPLAGTIFVIGWFTNYIPFFGAIISGTFAVLIALGSGGPSKAIPMLVIVIISNGYLQTIVSQFALGSALSLHPLAVLFATTAGSMLFGAVGGVFAAPLLKIAVDARLEMKAAGLFASSPAAGCAGGGPTPGEAGTGPPGDPADDHGQGEDRPPAGA